MSYIITSKQHVRGLKKPSPAARINPQHPLSQGLLCSYPMNEAGGLRVRDYARGFHGAISGATWTSVGGNPALYFGNSTSDVVDCGYPIIGSTLTACTVVARFSVVASVAFQMIARNGTSYTTNTFYLGFDASERLEAEVADSTSPPNYDAATSTVVETGVTSGVLLWSSGNRISVFSNGVLRATGTVGSVRSGSLRDGNTTLQLGKDPNFTTQSFLGSIIDFSAYSRALNPTEIGQLHAAPYSMFWEPGRRAIFVPMGEEPGGTAYERSLSDGISLGDSVGRAVTWARGLTDGMELGDGMDDQVGWARGVTDPLTLGDDVGRAVQWSRAFLEEVALEDAVGRAVTWARAVSEAVELGDSTSYTATYTRAFQDAIALGDTITAGAVIFRALTDAITLTDDISGAIVLFRELTDAIELGDSVNAQVIAAVITAARRWLAAQRTTTWTSPARSLTWFAE